MAVRAAQLAFEALPVALRRELGHDPNALEPWLRDPANQARALSFGLDASAIPGGPAPIPKAGDEPVRKDGVGTSSGGPGAVAPVV